MPRVTPTHLPELHQIALPTPFAVGDVNACVIEGDPLTLIDCGVNTAESFDALCEGLAALGHRIEEVGQIILSHHHVDHLGAVGRVVATSGAEVVAHPYTVPYVEMPQAIRIRNRNFIEVAFLQGGVPQAVLDAIEATEDYYLSLMGTAHVSRTLDEGDTLPLGGREWTVFHTPGHAGGLICLFEPRSRVLLSSDHILKQISSNPLIEAPDPGQKRPRRLLEYMHHLARVAALNPAIAYTGHGDPVEDVPTLVRDRLAAHRARAEKILSKFDGQPRTLYEMTQLMFPKVPASDAYLTLSEVVGHFDLLEVEGRIARDMQHGVVYWRPIGETP